ncbi:MAG: hypothetical protein U0525_02115 [Patescibacteria group bacterium]
MLTSFLSLRKSSTVIVITTILLLIFDFLLGIYIGKASQIKNHQEEISRLKSNFISERDNYDVQIQKLNTEIYAIKNDVGLLLDTNEEKFSKKLMELYSPFIENKMVEVTRFKYRDSTIIRKSVKIDDKSGIEIWQYDGMTNAPMKGPPGQFVTFGGYENYLNHAKSVSDEIKEWTEPYQTKKGLKMYYEYEYSPKSIGVVSLNIYLPYLYYRVPKPAVLRVWTSNIGGRPDTKNDVLIIKTKTALNKIADTIELFDQ